MTRPRYSLSRVYFGVCETLADYESPFGHKFCMRSGGAEKLVADEPWVLKRKNVLFVFFCRLLVSRCHRNNKGASVHPENEPSPSQRHTLSVSAVTVHRRSLTHSHLYLTPSTHSGNLSLFQDTIAMEQMKTRRRTQQETNQEVHQPDYRKMAGINPTPRTSAQVTADKAAREKTKAEDGKKNEERLKKLTEKLTEIESHSMPLKKDLPPKLGQPSGGRKKPNTSAAARPALKATPKLGTEKKVAAIKKTAATRPPSQAVPTWSKSTVSAAPKRAVAAREHSPMPMDDPTLEEDAGLMDVGDENQMEPMDVDDDEVRVSTIISDY